MSIRLEREKHFLHVEFIEKSDVIDKLKRGDDLYPFLFLENRPSFSFKLPDRGVAVQGHNQDVAFFLGFSEVSDMTDMNQVEATVSQHNFFPFVFAFLNNRGKMFEGM